MDSVGDCCSILDSKESSWACMQPHSSHLQHMPSTLTQQHAWGSCPLCSSRARTARRIAHTDPAPSAARAPQIGPPWRPGRQWPAGGPAHLSTANKNSQCGCRGTASCTEHGPMRTPKASPAIWSSVQGGASLMTAACSTRHNDACVCPLVVLSSSKDSTHAWQSAPLYAAAAAF